jgi:hypothetical protein
MPQPLSLADYRTKEYASSARDAGGAISLSVIDIHTHISFSAKSKNGVELAPERQYLGTPDELLAVMARKNIRSMVNLTGGYGAGLVRCGWEIRPRLSAIVSTRSQSHPIPEFLQARLSETAGASYRTGAPGTELAASRF